MIPTKYRVSNSFEAGIIQEVRGRRGTEWAMATHQVGESVLVLDPATFSRVSNLDEVGRYADNRYARAIRDHLR